MKRVLVIGGGGREHAIVDAFSRSMLVKKIYCAPGNAGIAEKAECVDIKDTDVERLLWFARENNIDLTVVGPEASLAAGVVDRFREAGLLIFGHTQDATRIESSKAFAKEIMERANIPTAAYRTFEQFDEALAYVKSRPLPAVIKYDGLAAGKGVVVAETYEDAEAALRDMLLDDAFGKGRVVIEDYLTGPEFSFMAFVDGENVYPMPLAQDHKRAFDGDKGPNTGGMGAYTPLPFITTEDEAFALHNILEPAAKAMVEVGCPLSGVLYAGLMKTPNGIRVIEFNARFGDPETEVILPLFNSDAYDVFSAIAGHRKMGAIAWHRQAILGVVLASKGYPGSYEKGHLIRGLENVGCSIYHMGTKRDEEGLKTNGGRVMMCLMSGNDLTDAKKRLYAELPKIDCDNLFYRQDIGHYAVD